MKKTIIFSLFLLIVCARAGADNLREIALGDSCMEQFDLSQALKHYEKAFRQVDNATIRMRLAECYYRRKDYQRCIQIVKPLPDDSLDHKTMRTIFYCHKSLSHSALQKQWGHKVVEKYPMDGEMVAELGMAYNLENNGKQAQKVCTNYWLKDHGNLAVIRVLADAYFLEREFDLAKYAYEELLAAGDTTYMALFNLGVCHEQQQSIEKAKAVFDQAIDLSEGMQPGALYHQGMMLNALRQYEDAQEYFERALALLLPDSTQMFICYRGIAEGLYAKADYASAKAAFGKAVAYDPTSLTSYYYLGLCCDATDDREKALANYRTFLRLAAAEESPSAGLKEMMADARKRMK